MGEELYSSERCSEAVEDPHHHSVDDTDGNRQSYDEHGSQQHYMHGMSSLILRIEM